MASLKDSQQAFDELIRGIITFNEYLDEAELGAINTPPIEAFRELYREGILTNKQLNYMYVRIGRSPRNYQEKKDFLGSEKVAELNDVFIDADLDGSVEAEPRRTWLTAEQQQFLVQRALAVVDPEELTREEVVESGLSREELANLLTAEQREAEGVSSGIDLDLLGSSTPGEDPTAIDTVEPEEPVLDVEEETPRFSIEPFEIDGRKKLLITDTYNPTEVQVLDPEEDALVLQKMEQDVQQGALDLEFRGQQIALGRGEFLLDAITTLAQLENTERAQAEQNRLAEIELLGEGGPGAFAVRQAIQAGQPTIATTGEVTAGGTRMPYEFSSAVREILNLGQGDVSLRPKSILTEDLSRGTRLGTPEGEPEALEAQKPLNVLEAGGGQIGTIKRDIQLGSALARLTPEDRVLIDELATTAGLGGLAGLQTEAQKTSAPRGTGLFTTVRS